MGFWDCSFQTEPWLSRSVDRNWGAKLEWYCTLQIHFLSEKRYQKSEIESDLLNVSSLLKSPFLDTSQMPTTQITLLHCVHRIYELYSLLKHNLPLLPFESFRSCLKSAVEFYQTYIPSLVDGSSESDLNGIKNAVLEFELWLPRFSSMTTKLVEGVSRRYEVSLSIREDITLMTLQFNNSYEATKHSLLLSSKPTQIPNGYRKTWCLQLTKPGSRHSFDVNPKSAVDELEIEAMECDVATSSAERIDGSDVVRREKRYSVTFGVAEMMHWRTIKALIPVNGWTKVVNQCSVSSFQKIWIVAIQNFNRIQ